MKYPQLVSVRAVSAISDWLVSRLEQLGVDAPVVYSRLLLSLLHTPLQVNALDLAEIPQLKGWLGRKGRRLTPSDAEALKRFAAVESLMEVASSDQQKSKVEDLVNELCQRLRDIENQNTPDYEESVSSKIITAERKKKSIDSTTTEDPTKRYYRAFPALSNNKNFVDEIPRKSASMSLTWPSGSINKTNSNNANSNNTAGVKRKPKRRRNQGLSKGKPTFTRRPSIGNSSSSNNSTCNNSKSLWDTDFSGNWEMGHDMIRDFIIKQNNRNRSISESDASKFIEINNIMCSSPSSVSATTAVAAATDNNDQLKYGSERGKIQKSGRNYDGHFFNGAPSSRNNDNINEEQTLFIKNMLQAKNPKEYFLDFDSYSNTAKIIDDNASISTFSSLSLPPSSMSAAASLAVSATDTSSLLFGNTMIRDEGYATPDTLTSLSEVDSTSMPRRLYEREVSNESIDTINNLPTSKTESQHLALFEAKFNRSVEALWDDKANNLNGANIDNQQLQQQQSTAPKSIDSFWQNYYKHHYDPPQIQAEMAQQDGINRSDLLFSAYNQLQPASFDSSITSSNSGSFLIHDKSCWSSTPPVIKQQQNNNVHNFIQAGTNIQSSIWSDNGRMGGGFGGNTVGTSITAGGGTAASNNDEDISLYPNKFWDNACLDNSKELNLKADSNLEMNMGYSISDLVGLSKWSDYTFETNPFNNGNDRVGTVAPSKEAVRLQKEGNLSSQHHDIIQQFFNYDCKSLPMTNNCDNSKFDNFSLKLMLANNAAAAGTSFNNSVFMEIPDKRNNNENSANENHVTLLNHSKNSGFVEVKPSPKLIHQNNKTSFEVQKETDLKSIDRCCKYKRSVPTPPSVTGTATANDDENLLTSDRTHFRPIKQTYADGYTFDIPSSPDDIKYERSDSGSIFFESEKYMEYNPKPNKNDNDGDENDIDGNKNKFTLKFCVRQIEKCCQTDDIKFLMNNNNNFDIFLQRKYENDSDIEMDMELLEKSLLSARQCIGSGYCISNDDNEEENDDVNSGDDCDDDLNILRAQNQYKISTGVNYNTIISGGLQQPKLECDLDLDNWTMAEMNKKCIDNNNSHTLWGHCSACNNDILSFPANRLLKDELYADGEEILSDLKYMQNLYIGSDWEDNSDNSDDENADNNEEYGKSHKRKDEILEKPISLVHNRNGIDELQSAKNIFYNVNKLISDLLKPETAKTLAQVLGEQNRKSIIEGIALTDKQQQQQQELFWHNVKNLKHSDNFQENNKWQSESFNFCNNGNVAVKNMKNVKNNNLLADGFVEGGLWPSSLDNLNIWKKVEANDSTPMLVTSTSSTSVSVATSTTSSSAVNNVGNACNIWSSWDCGNMRGSGLTDNVVKWEYSNLESIWSGSEQDNEMKNNCNPIGTVINENDNFNLQQQSKFDNDKLPLIYDNEISFNISNESLKKLMNNESVTAVKENNDYKRENIQFLEKDKLIKQPAISSRIDRKRRHSASQNLSEDICCCPIDIKFHHQQKQQQHRKQFSKNVLAGCRASDDQPATIITCKYWATDATNISSLFSQNRKFNHFLNNGGSDDDADNVNNCDYDYDGNIGAIMMNPSIFRHVPMVSRPLTR